MLCDNSFQTDGNFCSKVTCDRISLHVSCSNEDAISFYRQKGFAVVRRVEYYYRRLEPTNDAFYMVLDRTEGGVANTNFSKDDD